jgi:hypothetical protein
MSKDINTVGLTTAGDSALETIFKLGWFTLKMDLAKFALTYAIARDVKVGEIKGTSTVWNIGTLDADGSMALIVKEFYGEQETPYRCAEFLIDVGLRLMLERIEKNPDIGLTDLAKT